MSLIEFLLSRIHSNHLSSYLPYKYAPISFSHFLVTQAGKRKLWNEGKTLDAQTDFKIRITRKQMKKTRVGILLLCSAYLQGVSLPVSLGLWKGKAAF